MRHIFLFFLPLLIVASGPVIVVASAPVVDDAPMLVISGWGDEAEKRVVAAGGRIIGPVNAPLGVFALSSSPDFADRLRADGAWAVIDGGRIAAICGVET